MAWRMTAAEIRQLREELGLSQAHAAKMLGVNDRTWRRWELSESEMPAPAVRLLLVMHLPAVQRALVQMTDP